MSQAKRAVLISWIAVQNDPFDAEGDPGPTLSLLFHPESEFRGGIGDVVLFYDGGRAGKGATAVARLREEIAKRAPEIGIEAVPLDVGPVDHRALFVALREWLAENRGRFGDRELIVHASPGTGAKHTVWVLLSETGLIGDPHRLVQTLRQRDRGGRPPVVEVSIGLETPLKAFQKSSALRVGAEEPSATDPLSFKSEPLRALYEKALRLAPLKVPILVLGERGAGKTTIAQWIRANSPFRRPENDDAPPQVACGQFTSDLVRSELFGHVKGAFTDAKSDREGLLGRADGDTCFLDEVGDLDEGVQRLLIRAVETGTYTPEGSDQPRHSDFRLICATNRTWDDLATRVTPDFLDRISYFVLTVPPLRAVREDLPRIWAGVLSRALDEVGAPPQVRENAGQVRGLVLDRLLRHDLLGNYRDLYRVAYHLAAYLGDGSPEAGARLALEEALRRPSASDGSGRPSAHPVLRAYATGDRLDFQTLGGAVSTREVLDEVRRFMADEIREEAARSRQPQEALCDVRARTLQLWRKSNDGSAGSTP